MPGGPSRIFIAGYYGFGNAGDEAILAAITAGLRALRPEIDIIAASGDPEETARTHGIRAVVRDDLPAVARAMGESGLVILGGGGLFQDYWEVPLENTFTPRSGGLPFYAGYPLLAALMDQPAMVYAVGVGPLKTEEGRRLTRVTFDVCQGATVRDPASLALLDELGVRAELAADPAFGLIPVSGQPLDALWSELGLTAGERPVGIALRPWSFGPDPDLWESEVARALDGVDTGERLLLLPFQADEDVAVHRRLRERLAARGRAVLVERRLAPDELAGLLGRCGRALAMRYHAALFALAAGVPTAALGYDPKVPALFAEAGLADLALPPEAWREESIAAALGAARAPSPGFVDEMRRRARRSAELAVSLLDRGAPALSESQRFLSDLAVEKVLAAFGLELERDALRGEMADLAGQLAATRARLEADLQGVRDQARLLEQDLQGTRDQVQALERDRAGVREQRDILLAERNDLDRRLTALERTLAYRILSKFWGLMRRVFPEGSRRRKVYSLGRRALGKVVGGAAASDAAWKDGMGGAPSGAAPPPGEPAPDPRADLLRFEERVRDAGHRQVITIFSGTQLLESEGQRPTQFALALARRGVPVVFVYWRWWDHEWRPQDRLDDGILQIPIDVVTRRPEMLTGAFEGMERIALFGFPHPGFFETVSAANSAGWVTLYDVLDDWEEFHRLGQAIWFDDPFERHLVNACDAVFAINEILAGRIREMGGRRVEVVGNGLKPGLEVVRESRPLERGEVTVGYFGHLTGAWFDWELIAETARRRPTWRFHLIGYGGSPEGVDLPATVQLLGKQPQTDLAAFAANWDVAIIPFKPDRLAAGADPIKTYEYLAMGLPVVATGVYPPPGGEAYVARAAGGEEFIRRIEDAAREGAGGADARRAFAATCTWDHRLDAILATVAEGRQRVAEKRFLLGSPA